MIRLATIDDYEIIKKLVEELIAESVYRDLFKDYVLSKYMVQEYTTQPKLKLCLLSLDDKDNIVGFSAFDIVPWLYCDAPIKMARVSYIYVRPEYRKKGYGKEIHEAFEYWGKQVGATHYSTSHKSKGYKKVETIYMKEVK